MLVVERLLPIVLLCGYAFAQQRTAEKVDCNTAPAAVLSAAQKEKVRKGTERSCEKIVDNGAVLYEVKVTTESGKMREIVYRPNGEIVEFEDESQLGAIPAAARSAIQRATVSGELLKVDVIHRGKSILYEGEYRLGGSKRKVIVDAQGRTVD